MRRPGGGVNSTLARIGAVVGLTRADVDHPYDLYLKASWLHQYNASFNVELDGLAIPGDMGGSWMSYGAGFKVRLGQGERWAYGDLSLTDSHGPLQQAWQLNLGLRLAW